ncbi:MAG: chromosomal replication initiator protein DnaA [Bacteroidota bacterium]
MKADQKTVWKNFIQYIKTHINSPQSFKAWFAQIELHRYENKTLSIRVPSQFFCEWLEENYIDLLSEAITHAIGREGRLEYVVVGEKSTELPLKNTSTTTSSLHKQSHPNEEASSAADHDNEMESMSLNSAYRFDNLIEGDFNRLVKSIGQAIAQNPGNTSFNPFVIYGPVGSGKTHTMHAIGNKIKRNNKKAKVAYASSEDFTNFFVESLRSNSLHRFKEYYKHVDVLLLDDIQYLTGKEKTQEMLFHIFNQLHQSNKQIVITSDRPPRDLQGMQARLLSRFKWGITADLQTPDLEPRIAIVKEKIKAKNIKLSDEMIEYIAFNVKTNIRELEGVANSLVAYLSLYKKEPSLDVIKKIIQDIVFHVDMEVSVEYIQKIVAEHYKVSLEDIKGKCKKREIVTPRQVSMYLIKKYMPDYTLGFIGSHYEGRDHSTVGHSIQVVRDMLTTDSHFKSTLSELDKIIKTAVK